MPKTVKPVVVSMADRTRMLAEKRAADERAKAEAAAKAAEEARLAEVAARRAAHALKEHTDREAAAAARQAMNRTRYVRPAVERPAPAVVPPLYRATTRVGKLMSRNLALPPKDEPKKMWAEA